MALERGIGLRMLMLSGLRVCVLGGESREISRESSIVQRRGFFT